MMSTPLRILAPLLLLGPALLGCATATGDVDLMPQTLSQEITLEERDETDYLEPEDEVPGVAEIPEAEEAPQVAEPDEAAGDPSVIVIRQSTHEDSTSPSALAAASRRERERRANVTPVEVINDKNLAESAEGGQLTVASVDAAEEDGSDASPAAENVLEEEYWRSNALRMRLAWKTAVDDVARLQEEVAGLRTRFYDEDDPFYRDGEIKPAWDRSLEELTEARRRVESSEARLDLFLEEGRQAGALPGWLREGREYEPIVEDRSAPERRRDDPREPKVVEEEDWEPR